MPAALTPAPGVRDWTSEAEIAAILRGEPRRPRDPSSFAYAATRHQLAPLLVRAGVASLLPDREASRLRDEARRQAVIAVLRERELKAVIEALHDDGLEVLLFKGAHLASTCYPESHLRPRDDTDMLIRARDRDRVAATFARLGYARLPVQTGGAVLGQVMFDRAGTPGAACDVHLRVARPQLAAALFGADDLLSRAVPLTRVSAHARGPSAVDALALACVHQAAHHADRDLLLWDYDVYLLLRGFSAEERERFVTLAVDRRMTALCRAVIEPAMASFPDAAGAAMLERLRAAAGRDEPSAALLQPRGRLGEIRMDVRALPGWRARVRLIAGHLFPPVTYMRTAYAPAARTPLPWLYLRRLARGVTKSFPQV